MKVYRPLLITINLSEGALLFFGGNPGLKNSCHGQGFEHTTLDISYQSGAYDLSAIAICIQLTYPMLTMGSSLHKYSQGLLIKLTDEQSLKSPQKIYLPSILKKVCFKSKVKSGMSRLNRL